VLQQAPSAKPAQVRDWLVAQATQNIIQPTSTNNVHTMNSHLLYSLTTAPVELVGKPPKDPKPCTPRRQQKGEC
jgi:hypothetical protein